MKYDAFISYSHGADLELAKHVRDGLQKLSKPWNRRRALGVFLDQSSLELSSELGDSLGDRLDDTEWLVLLMSEQAATSKWVGEEIKGWAEAKSKDRIALVLTSGTVVWDDAERDFDYAESSAINENMRNVYTGQDSEPFFLDLTWTKSLPDGEQTLGLDSPRFRDAIATVSATIQGKSKDEVEGEDIRQHRRLVRLRRAAVSGLCVLTAAAAVLGIFAWVQRGVAIDERVEAEAQARRAESRALASDALLNAEPEPDLAALLALESGRVSNTADARGALVEVLSQPTRFLERIDEHDAPVSAVAFSESGRVAASGDQNGIVRIWDVNEEPLPSPQATVRSSRTDLIAEIRDLFVIDENTVLAFTIDGFISEIDLNSCSEQCKFDELSPPGAEVFDVAAFGLDAIAGQTADGVKVYPFGEDLEFGDPVDLGGGFDIEVTDLLFSPDGTHLALSFDNTVEVWEWGADDDPEIFTSATAVSSVAFSPDTDLSVAMVAVGELSGAITLFPRSNSALAESVLDPTTSNVTDIVFRPPGDELDFFQMASTQANGEVVLWSVSGEEGESPVGIRAEVLRGHLDEALTLAFSPDGRVASGDYNGEVIWWQESPVAALGVDLAHASVGVTGEAAGFATVAFVDEQHVVVLDPSGSLRVTDIDSRVVELIETDVEVWSLDAANGVIAVGQGDGTTLLLDGSGVELRTLDGHGSATVDFVALSSDGSRLASASIDEQLEGSGTGRATVISRDLDGSSEQQLMMPDDFEPSSLLVDDEFVLVGGQSGELPVAFAFDPATGEQIGAMQHSDRSGNGVTTFALSSDGAIIAIGASDRRITLWDTATFERHSSNELRAHRGIITGIAFWENDNTLLSVDDEGQGVVWDVADERAFAELGGPVDGLLSLDLSPAGAVLVAGGEDSSLWSWSLDVDLWRTRACELAGRNMTSEEWNLYGDGTTQVIHCKQFRADDATAVAAEYGSNQTN